MIWRAVPVPVKKATNQKQDLPLTDLGGLSLIGLAIEVFRWSQLFVAIAKIAEATAVTAPAEQQACWLGLTRGSLEIPQAPASLGSRLGWIAAEQFLSIR